MEEYKKNCDAFATIFNEEKHNKLMERGERKLSHHALWGALFIWLNRDEPRFHLPYQLLSLLTDLDALINRWRCKNLYIITFIKSLLSQFVLTIFINQIILIRLVLIKF